MSNTVIILGAGASAGASNTSDGGIRPPLDSGFFKIAAKRLAGKGPRTDKNSEGRDILREFKKEIKKARLSWAKVKDWRLEQLSTYLEAKINLNFGLSLGRRVEYKNAFLKLKKFICYALLKSGGAESCDLHRSLFELEKPSAIVSFNYDLIADQSLAKMGKLAWNLKEYSGSNRLRIFSGPGSFVQKDKPSWRNGNDVVKLLKLHGSMHWDRHKQGYCISGLKSLPKEKTDIFDYAFSPLDPLIIPPIASKTEVAESVLVGKWEKALKLLQDATRWIVWGYSFPVTDTIAQVLFRTALERNTNPKPIHVINPDVSSRERIEAYLTKVKVHYYSSVENYLFKNGKLVVQGNSN